MGGAPDWLTTRECKPSFWEKEAKTFVSALAEQNNNGFWFFFSKKNCFAAIAWWTTPNSSSVTSAYAVTRPATGAAFSSPTLLIKAVSRYAGSTDVAVAPGGKAAAALAYVNANETALPLAIANFGGLMPGSPDAGFG